MPDVFANITQAPPEALAVTADVLEVWAAIPQQQEMLKTYRSEIAFPPQARMLEVGQGYISVEFGGAVKAEGRRRAESKRFFGYMANASLVARKPL